MRDPNLMDILVCVKQTPDLDMVVAEDWAIVEGHEPDIRYANNVLNCFDEIAMEIALCLSERLEGSLRILTVGTDECDRLLRGLLALEADEAVRIDCADDLRFRPEAVAEMITGYLEEAGTPDVILMGRQAGEGDNAQTPQITAEKLRVPCVTNVLSVTPNSDGRLRVERLAAKGVQELLVKLPVVLAVGNVSGIALRSPTLKAKLNAKKRTIKVVAPKKISAPPKVRLLRFFNKNKNRTCKIFPVSSAAQAAVEIIKCINGDRR
jgi:electron transfer flavoprotein beta subunit